MPTIEHVIFIPMMLLAGGMIGFWLGAKSAKAEFERRQNERRQ